MYLHLVLGVLLREVFKMFQEHKNLLLEEKSPLAQVAWKPNEHRYDLKVHLHRLGNVDKINRRKYQMWHKVTIKNKLLKKE